MHKVFDLVIIGAGPGGYVSAIRAAQCGLQVAIVERDKVGGTCLNRGCIPTKTLVHTSHLYREMNTCEKLGITAEGISYDIEKIYTRKDDVVEQLRNGVEYLLKAYKDKIEMIRGNAVINTPNIVTVDTDKENLTLETKNILIATGSVPARPPIPGLELPGVITSDEILEQSGTAYKKLVIIGGGVIGVEFATVFNSLGCDVSIIEAMDRILPAVDKEISQNLSMILKKRGINIYTKSVVERIEKQDSELVCYFSQKDAEQKIESEAVLVAIGRKANVEGLFAEGLSVQYEGGIVVDEHFQTTVPGIYAIGDVIHGSSQLAHVASAQGCNAVMRIAGSEPQVNLMVVPSCIYTDPEIACVGLTADQAKAKGLAVKTGKFNMTSLGRSVIESQERSFAKLVFDAETEVLLGAQLMCARATDLIGEFATAIVNRLTIKQLGSVIRPHPSFTEGIAEAVEDVEGKAIHIAPRR